MASYLPPSEPPGCPTWDAPNTEDLDDAHTAGIRTRRGFHPSPLPTPTRAPAPVADEPDLDVIPESCPAGGEVEAETPLPAPTPPSSQKGAQTFEGWESGSKEDIANRRLKLAEAVYLHKAYDCPHGTVTLSWRAVVGQLKSNNSKLFALMKGPESTSYVGVRTYWDALYGEWKAKDDLGSKTSGASEDHAEFEVQMENIKKAHTGGEGQIKKRSRNSYGIGGSREEALAHVNRVLAGSLRGQAAVAAETVREQIEHGDVDDNGVVTPVTAPEEGPPAKRQTRGKGRVSSMHQSASVWSEAAATRAEVDRENIRLQREQIQQRNEETAAMRANTDRMFEMIERDRAERAAREERERAREDARAEREAKRDELQARQNELLNAMLMKVVEKLG